MRHWNAAASSHLATTDEVVVYASTQTPHTMRVALREFLGSEERYIWIVASDGGGGFGPRARLYPKEIILTALALLLGHPCA